MTTSLHTCVERHSIETALFVCFQTDLVCDILKSLGFVNQSVLYWVKPTTRTKRRGPFTVSSVEFLVVANNYSDSWDGFSMVNDSLDKQLDMPEIPMEVRQNFFMLPNDEVCSFPYSCTSNAANLISPDQVRRKVALFRCS